MLQKHESLNLKSQPLKVFDEAEMVEVPVANVDANVEWIDAF